MASGIGIDAKLFATKTLEEVAIKTNNPADRENVSLYIYEHPDEYRIHNIEASGYRRRPDIRLVVDYQEDFDLMEIIFNEMEKGNTEFDYIDLVDLFEKRPELINITKDVVNIAVAGRKNNK